MVKGDPFCQKQKQPWSVSPVLFCTENFCNSTKGLRCYAQHRKLCLLREYIGQEQHLGEYIKICAIHISVVRISSHFVGFVGWRIPITFVQFYLHQPLTANAVTDQNISSQLTKNFASSVFFKHRLTLKSHCCDSRISKF